MKSQYVLVNKSIRKITTKSIEFATDLGEVFLFRRHDNLTIWKLSPEGVLVHKAYAEAYSLI